MRKYYKLLFALILGVFVFFPGIKVSAEVLSDIRINSDTTYVTAGVLPEFTVTTTTDHASIETYGGGNTGWAHWEQGYQSWHGFGTDVPTATLNPNAHWGMRLAVNLDSGYEFDDNTRIFFNGVDVTGQEHNTIGFGFDWGGYVYIDLGNVDIGEPVYTVVYDYNGGNKNGEKSTTNYWVSFALDGTLENFMDGVTPPEGKELDYVLVNGERMDFPFPFEINKDYTVKYMWKNIPISITQFKLTGIPYPIVGKGPSTSGIKIATLGYENAKFKWIDEDANKDMTSSDTFIAGHHYILCVYDFNAADGYLLPEDLGESGIFSNLTYLKADYIAERPEFRLYFNPVTQVKRKITFDPNGGSVKPTYKNVYTYSTYGTLPKPSRKGCTFLGWYTAKSGGVKVVASTETKNTKNRILYARWTYTKYKITYYLNKGSNNKANPATYTYKTKTFYFKNPSRKGYLFKGWFKDAKFKSKITYIKKGTTGNKTVYAKWSAISYKVVYNANSGKGSMKASSGLKYDKAFTLRTNTFTKKGYKFTGWNTKKDGTGKTYADKAKVKNLTAKNGATVTLYAQWKKIAYTITYKLYGGTNNKVNPATYTITSAIIFKNPTKKGYSFKGWYSDSKLKNRITGIAKGSTGKKTVYAKWKEITYKINYETNGGQNRGVFTPYTFTINEEVWLTDCDRDGYLFAGWYLDKDLTNRIDFIPQGTDHNVTLYAKWMEDTEENSALLFAESFLEWNPYSRDRLLWYLQNYEPHYSLEAATYAVNNVDTDWYENAVREAQKMLALDDWSFSHDGLIEFLQNDSELFTEDQAIYAANNCGVSDWKVYAVKEAKILAEHTTYSRSLMIENLITVHLFSEEDAIYGVDNANINFANRALEAAKNHINAVGTTTRELLVDYLVNTLKFEQVEAEAAADALL